MSDAGTNFTSDEFQTFCRKLDIKSKITSSYHHSSNGQVENCIKLIKRTFNKCLKTNKDPRLALLQIRATPINSDLQSPAELLGRRM